MLIAIARTYLFPVAMGSDIAPPVPVPITASPDITRSADWLHFDDTFWWRLRRDNFYVLSLLHRTLDHHASLMDHSLYTTGSHYDHRYQRYIT
jgi:hypothetical protein